MRRIEELEEKCIIESLMLEHVMALSLEGERRVDCNL